MFRRFLLIIGGALFLVCFAAGFLLAQSAILEVGELIFEEYPQYPNDTIEVSGSAASGKTRWDYIDPLALPTSCYGSIYASCKGNEKCGFDAPDSKGGGGRLHGL